ncbi:uncharacterized protein LOC125647960 [Ostrea edulis]|uniref:uncharacterized protein LOC125647960 n=1 Tax=Ostrea edulis TaxID=37623 RepID=UPI0024AF9B84|nr:uncharacterized protein LOC125647960 [Ostrea edulis]XP_056012286.1 uncharacterized protein LOC125647960 [Ostrea edulis]XP_056012289.1 uncharacterized protein LOC125647960 [Ostrea edulis]
MVILHVCVGLLLLIGIQTIAQSCPGPAGLYIKRGVNTYCKKIYNCKPGHEIKPCDKTCEEEKCVPCPQSKAQPFLSHSDEHRHCFLPERRCNNRDTIPIENGTFSPSCAVQKFCECNTSKCFYGNPCICERNFEPCGVNEEMNAEGECVKCKEGYVKPYTGCDQCERIVPTPPQVNISTTIVTHKPSHSTTITQKPAITSVNSESPETTAVAQEPVVTKNPSEVKSLPQSENGGTTLIIIFLVVFAVLVCAIIVIVLLIRKYGRRRFLAKICRERGPPDAEARGRNHENGDVRLVDHEIHVDQEQTVIRESLMRMTSYPSDSGYEPHHPSLDSQLSQTSHVSVSTPVQATDSGDDLHPLLRTISQDHEASTYTAIPSISPVTGPTESLSLGTVTLDTPSTVGSMNVSDIIPEEINIDVKGTIPTHDRYITDEIHTGHDENRVRLGRTAAENEEDTEEKRKPAIDSLQFQKQFS